jgi:hypothetical protein
LSKFIGTGTESLKTFLLKFDHIALHAGWSEDEKLTHLMASLEDNAAQTLETCEGSMTYAGVREQLQTRYGTGNSFDAYRETLQQFRQKSGTGFQECAHEIERLSALGYPDMPPSQRDGLLNLPAFLNALSDSDLSYEVRKQKPKTLREAIDEAIRLDGWARAKREKEASKPKNVRVVQRESEAENTGDRGPPQRKWDRSGRPKQDHPQNKTPAVVADNGNNAAVGDATNKELEAKCQSLETRNAVLEERLRNMQQQAQPQQCQQTSPPPPWAKGVSQSDANWRQNQDRTRYRAAPGACYECNEYGHRARDCPYRRPPQ